MDEAIPAQKVSVGSSISQMDGIDGGLWWILGVPKLRTHGHTTKTLAEIRETVGGSLLVFLRLCHLFLSEIHLIPGKSTVLLSLVDSKILPSIVAGGAAILPIQEYLGLESIIQATNM